MERETLRAEMETVLGVNQDTEIFRLEIAKLKTLVQGLVTARRTNPGAQESKSGKAGRRKMQHPSVCRTRESQRGKLRDCAS